jgi:uncharacterized OsmC-like protein
MTLRELQAPLKAKYKESPDTAIVTLRAEGKLGPDVTCEVETRNGNIITGLHPASAGTGEHICSGDMLLESLAACAGVTMNAVATAMQIELRSATVKASGEIDFRGTLGVDKTAPVGFRNIRLEFVLDTDAPQEKIDSLIKLTERYCVVFQTLHHTPEMTVSHTRGG